MPCSASLSHLHPHTPVALRSREDEMRGGLASHASTFSGPDPKISCPAALGVGGRTPATALLWSLIAVGTDGPSESPNQHSCLKYHATEAQGKEHLHMQPLHASGVPCVPTCDKPCFKPSSSEIQRLLLPTGPPSHCPPQGPCSQGQKASRNQPQQRNVANCHPSPS